MSPSDPPAAAAAPSGPAAPEPAPTVPRLRDRGTVRHDAVRARRWELRGIAKVVHGVEVGSARLDGTVVVGGPLTAAELTVVGALEVRGPMTVTGRLVVRGALDADASVRAGEAQLEGPIRANGGVSVDGGLGVRGAFRAPSVRCGSLDIRGTIAVPGTVEARTVDARLVGDSTLGRVVAQRVRLRGPRLTVVDRVLGHEAVVAVERLEAATAAVEGARLAFVRAPEVVLGRDAHVVTLEGRLVRVHRSSHVGPESWSRPPAGLRR